MVILRSKEIREMEITDIQKKLDELKAEYAKNISESSAAGVYENPGKTKELKKTIARVLTIMNEKRRSKIDESL